jgi:DNA polymerase I
MEHHGVPIDVEVFGRLADPGAWRAVRDAMVPTIDAQYGVYVRQRHRRLDLQQGTLRGLPRARRHRRAQLETGNLNMRRKTFDEMSKGWPQLEGLRQLRHTRDKRRKIKLAVGADGRNRTVLWPFKSKTSRTQPKASEWIFSPAVWLRSLIKPGPGMRSPTSTTAPWSS